jgi:hypothetical protein
MEEDDEVTNRTNGCSATQDEGRAIFKGLAGSAEIENVVLT